MRSHVSELVDRFPDASALPAAQQQAGVTIDQLTRAAEKVLAEGFALRDGRVMREALAIASIENSEAGQAWQQVLTSIEAILTGSSFEMWIRPLSIASIEEDCLVLDGPPIVREWAERRYFGLIEHLLRELGGDYLRVRFLARLKSTGRDRGAVNAQARRVGQPEPLR